MTALGKWGSMPLRMGGGLSRARKAYQALKDGAGDAYSKDDSALVNKEKVVMARALARGQASQAAGAMQAFPEKSNQWLPEWEQRFGVIPSPTDEPHQRRAVLQAIMRGSGIPSRENIVAALAIALGGETVTVLTSTAHINDRSPATPGAAPSLVVAVGLGELAAGTHSVCYAYRDASGNVGAVSPTATIAVTGTAPAVRVSAIALPAGVVAIDYYLSLRVGETSMQYVIRGAGGAVVLARYPRNDGAPGLHHHSIIVSARTFADEVKVRKIHQVLGPMLSTWTTYSIAASSPFILGTSTSSGASPLGSGGL